ncbi:MAG TPA: hypothetical protein VFH95_03115 [Candidatus Kapabacteria bacterium]|nr:hypothetical protein [Candidatus Kapabacteria bacterium]
MKRIPLLLATAAIVIYAGCSSGDLTSWTQVVFPADSVSYARQVAPYLSLASCTASGCHDGYTSGAPDLTSWIAVRSIDVLNPYDTNDSQLVRVMKGLTQHSGPILANENQREGITRWVWEGAQNN